tara:strand:- start:838 stop:1206 length:369 start_codon:yes stop_codon:yes gene_type:complete
MGSKNQLFRRNPDRYIISDLLKTFNIESLDDPEFYFTKQDLLNNDIIDKMNTLKNRLEVYYIPCKAKLYLEDINEKKCITILRQFLKYIEYNLKLKEKYINGVKNYQYFIVSIKKKIIIDFD